MNQKLQGCGISILILLFVVFMIVLFIIVLSTGHAFDPRPAFDDW